MKKRITTILLTFAIAITGINTPTEKVNAETSEAKTSAETTAEAPSETTAPTQTSTPAPTRTPAIGECRGDLTYTPYGWMSNNDERLNDILMAAEAAEEAKKPHDIRIGKIDYSREEKTTRIDDGDTVEVTKDFSIEISFQAKGNASLNWTSSNQEAVTVTNIRQNGDKKTAVLNGKNYGSSVITMECNGYKASIMANVMKNEYKGTCFGLRTDTFSGKNKGLSHKGENFAEVKYNSKGNLVIKYTHKTHKWKNRKEKRKIVYKGRSHVTINEIKGKSKRVLNRYCGKFKITVSPKKPNATFTITIPKKYLKKTLDLRYCSYGVGITGKYCKEYVKKAK